MCVCVCVCACGVCSVKSELIGGMPVIADSVADRHFGASSNTHIGLLSPKRSCLRLQISVSVPSAAMMCDLS